MNLELYKTLHNRAGWAERHDVGRLWIRGQDRHSYLHNLLTNDIEALSAGGSRYAALLTPQGRMISDMHLFERGDALLMTVPHPLVTTLRDRLEQFIFSEDVQVEDATSTTVQIGVYGPGADQVVDALAAGSMLAMMTTGEFGLPGVEVIAAAERRDSLVAALSEAAVEVSFEVLEACRIEAGVPRFLTDMTDGTIPLEAGIEDRAISMTKGCYVGQEIIVRVLHRGGGRVARRLVRIGFPPGARVPRAGAPLYSEQREIGEVTSAVESPGFGRPIALGYVHRDFVEAATPVDAALDDGSRVRGEVLSR